MTLHSFDFSPDTIFTVHLVKDIPYEIVIEADWSRNDIQITGTISYSETAHPWVPLEEIEDAYGIDLQDEFLRLVTGQQELQGGQLFSFVPPESGQWSFTMSDFAPQDWNPQLILTDRYISFTVSSWAWRTGDDPEVSAFLAEGFEYLLFVIDNNILSTDVLLYEGGFTLRVEPYNFVLPNQTSTRTPPPPPPPVTPVPPQVPELPYITVAPTGGRHEVPANTGFTVFSFIPAVTGTWVIEAGPDTFPVIVRDGSRSFFAEGRRGTVTINLAAGVEYFIEVEARREDGVLLVSPYNELHHFVPGIEIMRTVIRETDFSFIPSESGVWVIETFSSWRADPYLWLLDAAGNIIAEDDDSGGSLNAFIKMRLTAGEEYTIRAGFYGGSVGIYTLYVDMLRMTEPEIPRLASPSLK